MPAERPQRRRPAPSASPRPLRRRAWSVGRLLLLAAGLSITFVAFFFTAMRVTNRAREVKVPDIRGQALDEAKSALGNVGLALRIDQRRADPKVALDHVLSQEPEPGTVLRRQRAVRVRVSDGQRDPVVPVVVGQAERTAEIVLGQDQVGIAGRDEIYSATYPTGTVVAQDPPAKNRAANVTLLVNRGERGVSFVMPDAIGALGVRVQDILRRRGFRVTIAAEVPYPNLPPGVVVRQTPQAGFQIGYGDAIVFEVSR